VSRVIWKMATGQDPQGLVDHKNGASRTNKIDNLRDITPKKNAQNRKMAHNNTTGFRGVSVAASGRFVASISLNRRMKHIGTFATKELAYEAYKSEREKLMGEAIPLCEAI